MESYPRSVKGACACSQCSPKAKNLLPTTHEMIGFRALRATYCTWSAVDARPVERVQRRAGHEGVRTTLGYYREVDRPQDQKAPKRRETLVEAPGIEPGSEELV